MRKARQVALLLATVGQISWLSFARADDSDWVRVVPKETDEILANPGMGWQTFHRTADDDKNLPSWIPSTVHYARWGWGTLEPEKGKIDYGFLDGILKETHEAGQKLAFRAMCCSSSPRKPYHPKWLVDIGGKVVLTRYGDGPELEVPVLDDPEVLAAHLGFIKRLGARYDGHPDIDHVDLGTVGWWGEWHMSQSTNAPMPTPETQKKIVDAYLDAFQKTPLVMLIGGGEMLKYAVENGAGWRADCLGDMGGFSKTWCHMRMAYPQRLPQADAIDAWKTAPVAWETCWDMRKWVNEGWSLRFIFNYALALHGSVINNKSAPLPEAESIRPEVERFLRRLGYRLVLKELRHPKQAKPGEELKLAMKWQNTGSAPCYRPYRLAFRLTDGDGDHQVFVGKVTVDKWLPGEIDLFTEEFFKQPADLPPGEVVNVADNIVLPNDIPVGEYVLSVGVVGVDTTRPVVQLGIQGRDRDEWYSLSKILVSEEPSVRQNEKTAPDLSGLKEGITLLQAKALLGSSGRLRENSSPEEAIYDFDFDETSAVLTVNTRSEQFEKLGYKDYTSAALHTKARSSYGYYEVKAKPMNSGGSSSFWFQVEETPGWLTEIDVFEIGGKAKGFEHKYNMNVHVFRTPTKKEHWSVGGVWVAPWRLADDYHVYGLEWTPEEITYFVDGVVVRTVENTHWHQPLFLIFDSETMPKWFGMPDDKDLPSTFSIEYVRAWKRQEDTGWTSLFNGRNLDGWTIKCLPKDNDKRGYWKVVNGTITAETPPGSKHNYIWLLTEREYGDFELRMKVQTYASSTGNSGIQVRSR